MSRPNQTTKLVGGEKTEGEKLLDGKNVKNYHTTIMPETPLEDEDVEVVVFPQVVIL